MQPTKLQKFMERNGITDTALSRESRVSVRQVNYIKLGEKDPRRDTIAAILAACRRLSGRPIAVTDLFDFAEPKGKVA
jgi:predicted transcriptional regulator